SRRSRRRSAEAADPAELCTRGERRGRAVVVAQSAGRAVALRLGRPPGRAGAPGPASPSRAVAAPTLRAGYVPLSRAPARAAPPAFGAGGNFSAAGGARLGSDLSRHGLQQPRLVAAGPRPRSRGLLDAGTPRRQRGGASRRPHRPGPPGRVSGSAVVSP